MIDTTHFNTAQENMDYDAAHFKQFQSDTPYLRFYEWQTPGITIPETRALPNNLKNLDVGRRLSGGGIVFHAPGDVVFSVIAKNDDPNLPKGVKGKLQWIANTIKSALEDCGIQANSAGPMNDKEKNIQYCLSYPNPYELTYNNEKILGTAIRRYNTHFLMQGVIHLTNSQKTFNHLPNTYHSYLTQGLDGNLSPKTLLKAMTKILKHVIPAKAGNPALRN